MQIGIAGIGKMGAAIAQRLIEAGRTVTTDAQSHVDEQGKVTTTGLFSRTWTITPMTTYCDLVVTVSWSEDGTLRQVVMRGKRSM